MLSLNQCKLKFQTYSYQYSTTPFTLKTNYCVYIQSHHLNIIKYFLYKITKSIKSITDTRKHIVQNYLTSHKNTLCHTAKFSSKQSVLLLRATSLMKQNHQLSYVNSYSKLLRHKPAPVLLTAHALVQGIYGYIIHLECLLQSVYTSYLLNQKPASYCSSLQLRYPRLHLAVSRKVCIHHS